MDNLQIYNIVRVVPANAKKEIMAGRLKGKTDINPMWRLKVLTEQFGPCGIGWRYTIDRQWTESGANGEAAAFCNISLYIKSGGAWSEAIPGTGGSSLIANERSGLYTSDECYKMALTDAISVACKALGIGADVYWEKDSTKYDGRAAIPVRTCGDCGLDIIPIKCGGKLYSVEEIAANSKKAFDRELCWGCMKKRREAQKEQDNAGHAG